MKKNIKRTSVVVGIVAVVVFLAYISSFYLLPGLHGSRNLGNNLYLLKSPDTGGMVILNATQLNGDVCTSGDYVIPSYDDHADAEGHVNEYVADVQENDDWMIVKTYINKEQRNCYYIVERRFDGTQHSGQYIKYRHVRRMETLDDFQKTCRQLNITLSFD